MIHEHGVQGSAAGTDAGDVLAVTAHELRGPITSILGYAETLRDRRAQMTKAQLEDALDAIGRQATRLDALLADLLLLAASRDGVLRLEPVAVPLRHALQAIVADDDGEPGEVRIDCDPDVTAIVDPGRLQQMVANYLANARLHGRPPRWITVRQGPGTVEVAVHDSGPGVDEAYRSTVFQRFARAPGTAAPGTGLGLAVVASLAAASGGDAFYRDDGSGGHAFVLVLPGRG